MSQRRRNWNAITDLPGVNGGAGSECSCKVVARRERQLLTARRGARSQ